MKPAYAEANSGKPEPVLHAVVKRADKWFETAVFWPSTRPESRYAMTGYIDLGWVTDACDAALHRALGFTHARLPRPKRKAENNGAAAPDEVRTPAIEPAAVQAPPC